MGRFTAGVVALAAAALTTLATVQPVQAADARPPLPDTTDQAFNEECLAAHNTYRARHGAPPLALDDEAVAHAVQRAQAASTLDGLFTPPGPGTRGYGENRYWFATYDNEPAPCEEAVRHWYEQRWTGGYDWDRPGYSPDTGAFTQVVWKETGVLGCGRASGTPEGGESHQTFIVCSYGPTGNVIGRFRANVGEPVED
ncbi:MULTISPECIES: CAP family protein [Streptomyces]|uniref:CAP family protein n=1 Tax=Streptomyces TaxID=1883 RepID=UPI00240D5A6F|nr:MULTISPECIES: CAP family protein [Streptomyces]WFB83752.1 CAP family protein [Streptomyces olivaceus]WGK50630.1 CAP family protein [Streptomyces sp. B146]